MNIYPLGTTASQNPLRVGGKAAHLARLAARHPVPPGFCIGACTQLAQPFNQALSQAYRRLGQRCGAVPLAVAVRSSAVDEDGLQASFAGQHESYLNVSGEEAVRQAVDRCIESAQSSRALAYRQARGLDEHSGVAVLVQQFIPADVSAVVFSADPTSGERGCVVINAAWGIGESLVGGEVTPDLYRVSKDDLRTTARLIADKAVMTVACPEGTRQVAVPRALRREPALDDGQIRALALLALRLEAAQGWAVDLECSFYQERFYLLQCRPVTRLS
ncbi:MAG: PEP/pyruvate-binding domain-containing protein [Anaerolineaceae bacterium]|nr:PEP/pyruvate-binding domain-containing protein [Anaerolineaceae bacterium]